jgi:hypothetical protein
MYEIWLMLNIVWEYLLAHAGWAVAFAVLLVAAFGIALMRGGAAWGRALPAAIGLGVVVAAIAFFVVPGATKSSFANFGYWVDWANLLAIAGVAGAAIAAIGWPLIASARRRAA